MRRCFSILVLVGMFLPSANANPNQLSAVDSRYYRAIQPTEKEIRWKQVPWLQDLGKAIETAKKEKRPIFLWATDDEPLERC